MRRKLLVFLVLALALLLARPPASLFDAALAHFTGDGLRLLQAEGSLWNGHGVLASRSPDGRSVAPWLPLAWRFDSAALTRGALRWVFTGSGKPLATLEAGAGGLSVDGLGLFTPADAALASIPHPVARAGWQDGQPWGFEVKLPQGFPYQEAELDIDKPVAHWQQRGVRTIDGQPLPALPGNTSILVLAAMIVAGIVAGVMKIQASPDEAGTVGVNLAWCVLNLVTLGGAIAVAQERAQRRNKARIDTSLPCELQFGGTYPTQTLNRP